MDAPKRISENPKAVPATNIALKQLILVPSIRIDVWGQILSEADLPLFVFAWLLQLDGHFIVDHVVRVDWVCPYKC